MVKTRIGGTNERAESRADGVVQADLKDICERLRDEFSDMGGTKLLITGGAGFLGHYLVRSVLHWNSGLEPEEQIRVTIFDNWIRGVPQWLQGIQDPNLQVVDYDLGKPLGDLEAYDYVIHGASIASPTFYRKHPIETMDANVNGLRSLLEHCLQQRDRGQEVRGFLFFSSSEIYGDPDPGNIPTPESYLGAVSTTGPRACYDESKRYGETLCVNFARVHDLPIKIARPFNNYGPGLRITDRRVLADFARDVLAGRDIVLLSDGSPTRTFCYVADAVVGYFKILVRGRSGEAYNIGADEPEISMAELAEQVVKLARELFEYRGRVVYGQSDDQEYLVDNPNRRCPLITKARDEIGYEPEIPLAEGLRRSLLWYQANRENTC